MSTVDFCAGGPGFSALSRLRLGELGAGTKPRVLLPGGVEVMPRSNFVRKWRSISLRATTVVVNAQRHGSLQW